MEQKKSSNSAITNKINVIKSTCQLNRHIANINNKPRSYLTKIGPKKFRCNLCGDIISFDIPKMFITNPEKDFMADMTTSDAERYLKEMFENDLNRLKDKKELGYNDVIDRLNDFITHFGIDREDLLITYGAALVLRGVKKFTSDIDLSISAFIFDRIRERYDDVQVFSKSEKDSHLCFKYGDIEVFRGVVGMAVFPESDLEQHCGFMVQTIKSIREEKSRRGRIKDMRDVDLIDKFLALEQFIAMPWWI